MFLVFGLLYSLNGECAGTNVLDRAQKMLSAVSSWENSKKAATEAKLRKNEVSLFFFSCSSNLSRRTKWREDCLIAGEIREEKG